MVGSLIKEVLKKSLSLSERMPYVFVPDNVPAGTTYEELVEMTEHARAERKRRTNIECLKRFRERHREQILEQQKAYREANRETLAQKKREYRARQKFQAATKSQADISFPENFLTVV